MLNQNSILSSNTSGSGSADGDVVGPASSTDNAAVRYNGTTGKLVQNSTVTIDDSGTVAATSVDATTTFTSTGTGTMFRAKRTGQNADFRIYQGVNNTILDNANGDQIDFAIGGTARAFLSATGLNNAAIGATTPSTGAFTSVAVGTNAGFGGSLSQFNGSNAVIANTAGQFSIGTTDTAAADVGGSLGFTANTTTLAGYPMGSISARLVAAGAGAYESYMAFATTGAGGTVAERMRITDTGNVGIGTTSPNSKVDSVQTFGDGFSSSFYAKPASSAQGERGGYSFAATFEGTADNTARRSADIYSGFNGGAWGNEYLAFGVGLGGASNDAGAASTEQMRITGAGRVGVGTSSPQGHLHINTESAEATEVYVDGENNQQKSVELRHYDASEASGAGRNTFYFKTKAADKVTLGGYDNSSSEFEIVTFEENGNVGIGTASPAAAGAGKSTLDVNGPVLARGGVSVNQTSAGGLDVSGNDLRIRSWGATAGTGSMSFRTGGGGGSVDTERMRINSGGDVFMHGTSINGTENDAGYSAGGLSFRVSRDTTANANQIVFYNPNGAVGAIKTNGSATAYNTSSDYRLKENVVPMSDALQRIGNLKPSRFNFIANDSVVVDGFLAHEVQEHVPEAISGEKDAMKDEEYEVTPAVLDDDGNEITPAVMDTRSVPEYQGIDQSKLVPLLVGAVKELTARIAALENS